MHSSPQEIVLDLLYGRWRSQTAHAGAALGIFDAADWVPRTAPEIARTLGLDEALARRLLRALRALGLLEQHARDSFTLTEAGELLRADHPLSMRDALLLREGTEHTAIWKHLPAMVRDGRQDGFLREYGMTGFEYAARHPAYREAFDAAMSSQSHLQTRWALAALADAELGAIGRICDVGGGHGHLLAHLLQRHPRMQGTLLERPGVFADGGVPWAERLGVAERCVAVAGDMFAQVPPADAYVMKMILHDWNDDACLAILSRLHASAAAGGRVFVIEHVQPESGSPDYAFLYDMHMLCWGGGRERSEAEYVDLLRRAGWSHAATWYAPNEILGVVEGAKRA
jgi:hypothetical protein